MAKGEFRNLSFRAGTENTEDGVVDKFSTTHVPKLKFNFTISFKFRQPIVVQNLKGEDETMDEMTFALKQASRPNPTINYKDVNFYNYRTKVATRMDYGTMQVTLYDDVENFAHNIYEIYLKSVSPIANLNKDNAGLLNENARGMKNTAFNTENIIPGDDSRIESGSASIGPLPSYPGGEFGILENITIRHFFYSQSERRYTELPNVAQAGQNDLNENLQYVEYQFLNPKMVNMTLDELDMTQSEANTMMMTFNYDSVFINSPNAENINVDTKRRGPDGRTFSLDDIRSSITDVQRLVKRVRRLDTIPDISVLEAAGTYTPPITGNLPNIQLPKPKIELPPIINF